MRKLNEKDKTTQPEPAGAEQGGERREKEVASAQDNNDSDEKPDEESGETSEEESSQEDVAPDKETEVPDSAPDENHEEQPSEAPQAAMPGEGDPEKNRLKEDLLLARSQIAAYSAGVASEMVADAVTLAMAEARSAGEVTEDAVAKAMANVLKRHPEWKAQSAAGSKKASGGFKLGPDPDRGSARNAKKAETGAGQKKPWNKFNR